MGDVEPDANQRPQTKQRPLGGRVLLVEPEDADRAVVKSVEHAGAGREIVGLLGDVEITGMKDHAEHPARDTEVAEHQVVSAEGIVCGQSGADLGDPSLMREQVQ